MAATDYIKNYSTYQVTLTLANTEYSQVLSDQPTKITVACDDLTSSFLIHFTSGLSGSGKSVFPGAEWSSPGFVFGSKTVYLQSPNAGAIVIIEEWQAP